MSPPAASRIGVDSVNVAAYRVPTDRPESDGTLEWTSTTVVVVEVGGGGVVGLGLSYASVAAAALVEEILADVVRGRDAQAPRATWAAMARAVRNVGRPGVASTAIAAVDIALWDLHAKLLGVPLVTALGRARDAVPAYGSGGFTSYSVAELQAQLGEWANAGLRYVKMKVGRDPATDGERVRAAREAIGDDVGLFVDANGAYAREQALAMARRFAGAGVTWFEEPVSSDDLRSLAWLRERAPAGMAIAAGEYGWDAMYFRRMLGAGAVHVLQADATRCGGVTGFVQTAGLCEAFGIPLSAHTAPSVHAHVACACERACNVEFFHDHARLEGLLFEGALTPRDGMLSPDTRRPGLGLALRPREAARWRVYPRE